MRWAAQRKDTPQEKIHQHFDGWVERIVPPIEDWTKTRPFAPFHAGNGLITDDTLLAHALIRVYETKRDHLDAFDMQTFVQFLREPSWIPELDAVAPIEQRMWLAEKYMTLRLIYGNVDPREAGVGNACNCGAAMYIAPVGIVNAANPRAAYAEAIDMTGAHQASYGREAAGVLAAAVAEALRPGASADSVVQTALAYAKDGTRDAIDAVCKVARTHDHWKTAGKELRNAVAPYDTLGDDYMKLKRDSRVPSRSKSIEELPIAIGYFLMADGRYVDSVLGCVNYGRDSDSIAAMAGAIAGALGGLSAIPVEWYTEVAEASHTDLLKPASDMMVVTQEIFVKDQQRARAWVEDYNRLTAST